MRPLYVGTAGWNLPRSSQHHFPMADPSATQLERYAQQLSAVEINSSFYRPHHRATYERWASCTPYGFRFSVKLPRTITHTARLQETETLLETFLEQVSGLGHRLGCLLVQLPPSLAFNAGSVDTFVRQIRHRHADPSIAIEPRHASWFAPQVDTLLAEWKVARVLADPVLHENGNKPGGWDGLVYCRLHGSPHTYYSAYEAGLIEALKVRLQLATGEARSVWCIFDNTARGAATKNALDLYRRVKG